VSSRPVGQLWWPAAVPMELVQVSSFLSVQVRVRVQVQVPEQPPQPYRRYGTARRKL
jgi:hypothetical protein